VRAAVFLLALALAGCTVTTERHGDPHYVHAAPRAKFKLGHTTSLEVAQALGPPDRIERQGDNLWFRYRFNDRRTSSLILSYYLNWISRRSVHSINSQMIVVFDAEDRLLHYGVSDIPSDGALMRHFD
jgi:hypothetical protein